MNPYIKHRMGLGDAASDFAQQVNQSWFASLGAQVVSPFKGMETDATYARRMLQSTGADVSRLTDQQVLQLYNASPFAVQTASGVHTAAQALNPLEWEFFGIALKYWILIGGGLFLLMEVKR